MRSYNNRWDFRLHYLLWPFFSFTRRWIFPFSSWYFTLRCEIFNILTTSFFWIIKLHYIRFIFQFFQIFRFKHLKWTLFSLNRLFGRRVWLFIMERRFILQLCKGTWNIAWSIEKSISYWYVLFSRFYVIY